MNAWEWRARVADAGFSFDDRRVFIARRTPDGTEFIVGFDAEGRPVTETVPEGAWPQHSGLLIPADALVSLAEELKPGPSTGELRRLEEALEIERARVNEALAVAKTLWSRLPVEPHESITEESTT